MIAEGLASLLVGFGNFEWTHGVMILVGSALLYLGIKNIRLGPTLPAFITPNILEVLVKNFDLKPISTPDADLKAILG